MNDKENIRAEVERLKDELIKWPDKSEIDMGRISAFEDVLLYIDSLKEEPVSEDLEEKAKRYAIAQVLCTTDTRMCEQAYLSLRIFNGYDVACAYKDGADGKREQMMKDAIEGDILNSYYPTHIQLNTYSEKFNDGDKVKVIVVKEAEK